jgi:hypothetical protein
MELLPAEQEIIANFFTEEVFLCHLYPNFSRGLSPFRLKTFIHMFTCIGEQRRQQAIQTRNQIPTPPQSRPTMKYQVGLPINPDP